MSSGLYSSTSGLSLGVGLYRRVSGLWGGASGLVSGFGNPIPPLFAGGAAGAWFDFTDTSTWYQDAARTTPAATLGDVVGGIADKSGRGNHASQATTAQKPLRARMPLGGRRNMLTYTEDFSNAAWSKTNATASTTKITENSSLGQHSATQTATVTTSTVYTVSVELKAGERTFARVINYDGGSHFYGIVVNLTTGAFISVSQGGTHSSDAYVITDAGDGYWRIAVTTSIASTFRQLVVNLYSDSTTATYTGDGTSGLFARNAQMDRAATPTAYQKVVADWDVTESGVTSIPALYYDGSDDSLATAAIDFTGTDKMTVFAGVLPLANSGMIAELSADAGSNNGAFYLFNNTASYDAYSKGASGGGLANGSRSIFQDAVLTALFNISGDSSIIRGNGAQLASSASDQGAGNYGNYAIYFGRRGGTSLPFKGYMIGHLVIVGKLANASEIAAVEATERAATGAY